MLYRNEVVFQVFRFVLGFGEQLVQPRRDVNLIRATRGSAHLRQPVQIMIQMGSQRFHIDTGAFQNGSCEPALL